MRIKKYLLLCLLVAIGCGTNEKQQQDQVKVFLTEWSTVLKSKDESVRRFYDAQFVFPKILFEAAEGLQFALDIENFKVVSQDDKGDMHVTVPFQIISPGGSILDQGLVELTVAKTENGFFIRDMSQELAMKIKEQSMRLHASNVRSDATIRYDSILSHIQSIVDTLSEHYDSVVYFTEVENDILFYVVSGSWNDPYPYEEQRDGGNFKLGVVTAKNKIIIPVEYAKIYNPNGSFDGMIEVENEGLRGLFTIDGNAFIPAEFDGIYPTAVPDAIAQVKKGEEYGWVDLKGKVSFDPASHANKELFKSPVESDAILGWEFTFPGPVSLLVSPYDDPAESTGLIVYPSFVRDLGITPIANAGVMLQSSQYGMGMSETTIKFESVASVTDQLFGLVSFFMEAGADARGYQNEQNDLLVLDKNMATIDHKKKLTEGYDSQDPCGETPPTYKVISPGLYESSDGHGHYKYYQISAEGYVNPLETDREYNFTKFAKIDESYFNPCRYESFDSQGEWDSNKPNMVVLSGLSYEQLDVMRNEIFAEYGFIFKSERWKTYFEDKVWYEPKYENVDKLMNATDKHNVKFILEYQRSHKDQEEQRDSIQFMWAG